MTALPCYRCGTIAPPTISPGIGPHGARADCSHCGGFIKWLPKPKKGIGMDVNEVILLGTLARDPEDRQTDGAKAYVAAALCCEEGTDERTYKTYIPVQAFGKAAAVLRDLKAETPCLIRGKLTWRSWQVDGQKQGRLEVLAWSITPAPMAVSAGN